MRVARSILSLALRESKPSPRSGSGDADCWRPSWRRDFRNLHMMDVLPAPSVPEIVSAHVLTTGSISFGDIVASVGRVAARSRSPGKFRVPLRLPAGLSASTSGVRDRRFGFSAAKSLSKTNVEEYVGLRIRPRACFRGRGSRPDRTSAPGSLDLRHLALPGTRRAVRRDQHPLIGQCVESAMRIFGEFQFWASQAFYDRLGVPGIRFAKRAARQAHGRS